MRFGIVINQSLWNGFDYFQGAQIIFRNKYLQKIWNSLADFKPKT